MESLEGVRERESDPARESAGGQTCSPDHTQKRSLLDLAPKGEGNQRSSHLGINRPQHNP